MFTLSSSSFNRRIAGVVTAAMALTMAEGPAAEAMSSGSSATTSCAGFRNSSACELDALGGAAVPYLPPPHKAAAGSRQSSVDEQALQNFLAACRSTYVSPSGSPLSTGAQKGGWYYTPCAEELGIPTSQIGPLAFLPDSTVASAKPALSIALEARRELVLSVPSMLSSPGPEADVPKVVNVPTWAWIDKAGWTTVTATASAPGVSVTATASPEYVGWLWGDGSSSECRGPGTPYVRGVSDPAAASPDCGHTYTQTSKRGPGLRFPVTATVHWRITWRATTGQSGQFSDMTSRAAQAWPVEEIDALNIPGSHIS